MKKCISRLRVLGCMIMMIALVAGCCVTVLAEDTAPATVQTEKTVQTTKTESKALTAKEQEKLAIEKYGYYKGKNAKRIPVITYHCMCRTNEKGWASNGSSLIVSQGMFDRQMKWLHDRHYRTINCEEFYLWYKGKIKLPPKTVLITFDDGFKEVVSLALPVLKKYDMKATSFIIGRNSYQGTKSFIPYKQIKKLSKSQDLLEFQSHTYGMHNRVASLFRYSRTKKDAKKQKKIFGFDYLAYPFGTNNSGMRKAYRESGIKIAFTYGSNGYATRKQDAYQIRRIKIDGNDSMSMFTRWFN